jgi:4-aminobutyrate aminotransferase/(S)-3-amino-2-methylpropionate transaminase
MRKHVVLRTEIPGPRSRELMARVHEHTPAALAHMTPIAVARAEGALLHDVDGNTLLDFAGGIGVANVGHCAPEVVTAIQDQAGRYLHQCFIVSLYEPYVDLAQRLNELAPGPSCKKTILFNSGAEAVENAVKIARAFTRRPAVLCFDRAFHGRTLLALALTGQMRPYKLGFAPFPGEIYRLPYPYCYRCPNRQPAAGCCLVPPQHALEDLFRAQVRAEDVAAVIVEPVLGEGGFVVPPPGFLRDLYGLCQEIGALFIADEIQTGFGRTGRRFAVEHEGVEPDLLVMAKSLAGGETLSAVTGRAEILDALPPGSLGGTFGGNPLACRAALAAIEILEKNDLPARANDIGQRVRARFQALKRQHPLIGDVRGLGAMMALELVRADPLRGYPEPAREEAAQVIRACYERGLIMIRAGAGGNVLRTLMPLVITDEQLDEGLDILEEAIAQVTAEHAGSA